MSLIRIVSGGQSGVDTGALLAANALGLETGGWAPKGWMTEDGPMQEFMQQMGLRECLSEGYVARTEMNVRDSDGTLIIVPDGFHLSGGTYTTDCIAASLDKPTFYAWFETDHWVWTTRSKSTLKLSVWLQLMDIRILNVAGPRASKWPDGCELACAYLIEALS